MVSIRIVGAMIAIPLASVLPQAAGAAGTPAVVQTPARPVPRAYPPAPQVYAPVGSDANAVPVVPMEVTFSFDGKILWGGTLNVGQQGTRVSINEPMARDASCDLAIGYGDREVRSVELSLNASRMRGADPVYRLTARYSRPGSDVCGGTRTISIEQPFRLTKGKRQRFEGDAGLRVDIAMP